MDWHMYLILFVAIVLFIGIALFMERAKGKPKDPLSIWNVYSEGSDRVCGKDSHKPNFLRKIYLPHDHGDLLSDPAFRKLPGNAYHDYFQND